MCQLLFDHLKHICKHAARFTKGKSYSIYNIIEMVWKYFTGLLSFVLLIDLSMAIQCFICGVTTEIIVSNGHATAIPPCSTFDGSSKFIMECPYSTMCLRTIHTMHLLNGYERTTTLGCAQQKYSQHVLRGRVWEEEHSVKDIYPEDCLTITENNLAASTKTHCYCRGNLCNLAKNRNISTKIIGIQLFVVMLTFCFVL